VRESERERVRTAGDKRARPARATASEKGLPECWRESQLDRLRCAWTDGFPGR